MSASHANLIVLPSRPIARDEAAVGAVAGITGLPPCDVRQRFGSVRPAVLMRSTEISGLEHVRDGLAGLGHGAVVVSDDEVRRELYPLSCRGVTISRDSIDFLDESGCTLATLPRCETLLLIVTNLRWRGENPLARLEKAPAATPAQVRADSERRLARLLADRQEGILLDLQWSGSSDRVRIVGDQFNYRTMGELAGPGITGNVKTLIGEITARAARPVLDLGFGGFQPPRTPGLGAQLNDGRRRERPQDELEAAFENYCRHVGLAWRKGLFVMAARGAAATAAANAEPADAPAKAPGPPPLSAPVPEITAAGRAVGRLRNWGPPLLVLPLAAATVFGLAGTLRDSSPGTLARAVLPAGLLALVHALALFGRRRRIENVPTSRIRSAAAGLCEVSGTAQPLHELRTPWSLMPCVYYEYRVVIRDGDGSAPTDGGILAAAGALRSTGRGDTRVQTGNSGHVPFLVQDDTGSVEVNPAGAIVEVSSEQTLHGLPFEGPPLPASGSILIHERYIPVGYPVYVMGELRPVIPEAKAGRAELARRIRALKSDGARMAACDTNGDGAVDELEWESARRDVATAWQLDNLEATGRADRLVIGRPAHGGLFYISERSEKRIVRSLAWRNRLALAVGIVLTLWGMILAMPLWRVR